MWLCYNRFNLELSKRFFSAGSWNHCFSRHCLSRIKHLSFFNRGRMHLHNIYETFKVTFATIFKLHHVRLWLKVINRFSLSWTMLVAKVVKQWSKYTFDQGSYLLRARFVFFNSFLKNSLSIICSCCKPRERYSGFWISDHLIGICSRGGSSGRMRAFCSDIPGSNPITEANFFG